MLFFSSFIIVGVFVLGILYILCWNLVWWIQLRCSRWRNWSINSKKRRRRNKTNKPIHTTRNIILVADRAFALSSTPHLHHLPPISSSTFVFFLHFAFFIQPAPHYALFALISASHHHCICPYHSTFHTVATALAIFRKLFICSFLLRNTFKFESPSI